MKEPSQLLKKIDSITSIDRPLSFDLGSPSIVDNGYRGYVAEEDTRKRLRDYLRVVRKYLWMIIGITVLVTMITAVYEARQPSVYQARARVQVDLEDSSGFGTANKGSALVLGATNDPVYFNTQLQTLSSSELLRRVVRTVDLEHNSAFLRAQGANVPLWQGLLGIVGLGSGTRDSRTSSTTKEIPVSRNIAPPTSSDDLIAASELQGYVNALLSGLAVEPVKETRSQVKETRLIEINFRHLDPVLAARIANTVADVYVRSNLEKKSSRSIDAGDFLQKRIAELQSEIRHREEELISYAKTNQILSLDPNQNTVVERLTGLNRQLLEAENERKAAEAAYRASLAPGAAEAIAERDAGRGAEIEKKLAELKVRRAQLLVENTEEWPEVKEIDKQIAELEKQLGDDRSKRVNTLRTNLETQYRQNLAKEQSLQAAFDQQRKETADQNEAAINYRIIQQEIETYKGLLDGLLQRAKENEVLLAGIANNVSVVDYATIPTTPIGPKRLQNVELAFVLSLLVALGLAFVLDSLDSRFQSSEDFEKATGLPTLAAIPRFKTIEKATRRRSVQSRSTVALLPAKGNGNGYDASSDLLFCMDTDSPVAESFRQLRTTVLLSTPGRAPKTLLVTSSTPGDGKTITAINTACILAQTGASVVVIDADMRHSRLHNIFGLDNARGLSTVLSSNASEEEILSIVKRHEASNIHVLPSGPAPANPAELLGSEQMSRLLAILGDNFAYIVLDSPPVNYFTDSVILSSLVDGVLLVVHTKKTSRDVMVRCRKLLSNVDAKVFGVVVNHAQPHVLENDYYSYYESGTSS